MEWIVAETQDEWLLRGFLFIVANALVMVLTLKSGLLFHSSSNSLEFEITRGSSSSPISFPITPPPPAEAEANLLLVHYPEGFCTTTTTAILAGTNSSTNSHSRIDEKAEVEYDNGDKTSANVNNNCLQSKRLKMKMEMEMEMDRYELRRRADDFIAEFRKELRLQRDSSWQNLQSMYLRSC